LPIRREKDRREAMKRMRKKLALFLAICLLFNTYGGSALAAEAGSDKLKTPEEQTGNTVTPGLEDLAGDTVSAGKEEESDGTGDAGTGEGAGSTENTGKEEESDGAGDAGTGEEAGGTENSGTGEEESDDTGDVGTEEEAGSTENSDTGEEESDDTGDVGTEEEAGGTENSDTGEEELDGTGDADTEEETDDTESDDSEEDSEEDGEEIDPVEDSESAGDEDALEELVTVSENDLPGYDAASVETEGNFSYTFDEKTNTVTLNGYAEGYSGGEVLNIPETLGGYPVVEIKSRAFEKKTILTTVVMPDSVQEIGGSAFSGCLNLVSVTLSKGLVKTGSDVFKNCTALTGIEIPKSLEGSTGGMFNGCTGLRNVTFEEGVTRIADHLLHNCPGITEMIIPNTVTVIEKNAFDSCANLAQVTIPGSVAVIETGAFAECGSLRKVVIPDSVTEVGSSAFYNCVNLVEVILSKHLATLGLNAFSKCSALTSIEIPKSLEQTTLSLDGHGGVFRECGNLKSISFENGTTQIVRWIFAYCDGLEEITIPDTVTKIGNAVFYSCKNLRTVNISGNVTEIGSSVFRECLALQEIVIPDSVTSIGTNAFYGCVNLSKVTLSKNLKSLGYHAFYDCNALTAVEIPKSLERAETTMEGSGGVFVNCTSLKSVSFESGRTKIPRYLFAYCRGLEEIVIPDTVQTIESSAFRGCVNLTKIDLQDGLTQIGNSVFLDCSALKDVVIPESCTTIGNSAFENCINLASAVLPSKLDRISEGLFRNSGVNKIDLPDTVSVIEVNAFRECAALTEIKMPANLQIIENYAFQGCTALAAVTFPENLQSIGRNAFSNCNALTAVTIPDSVRSLGDYLFAECELLRDVTLGTGITIIPSYAFNLCPSLTKIVIPYYVTTVKANAFTNCTSLTEVTIPRAVTTIAANAFSYFDRLTIYGVSGTYAETYANTQGATFVNQEKKATEVRLNKTELKLANGRKTKLVLSVTPSDFTDEVSWKSSDEKVVQVADTGEITAWSLGMATIKVTVGDVSASCKVTVTQPVTSISLNITSLVLEAGDTQKLTATVSPSSAENKEITWSTSNEEIVTVDEQGLVTGHRKGSATVTATAQDGSGVSKRCEVEVKNSGYICSSVEELESPHNYPNNCSDFWLYTKEGAESLWVTFDGRTMVEEDFDFIYIFDGSKKQIGRYTGAELAGETVEVPGDTVRIKLESDDKTSAWGFKVTRVMGTGNVENDEYQVTFDTQGGTMIYPVAVEKNTPVSEPEKPVKPGFVFVGWYLNGEPYDFAQPVVGNMILRAKWVIDKTGPGPIETPPVPEEDRPADGSIPEGLWIAGVKDQVYTGKAHKPEVRVYDGAQRLQEKTDYTISHKNNTKANDATDGSKAPMVMVKGKGNYAGSATAVYKINAVDLNDEQVFIPDITLAYNGNVQKKAPTVTFNGKKLSAKRDYTVAYVNTESGAYQQTGTYQVKLTGTGNFTGEKLIDLEITDKKLIEKAKYVKIQEKTYEGGGEIRLSSSELILYMQSRNEPLVEGTDYTVSYENNLEIGTATAVIKGVGSYAGTKRIPFKIVGTAINSARVDGIVDKIYDGTEQSQDITVWVEGTRLEPERDYTVTYSNRQNVGKASVVIQGINAYSGTVKKTFKITAYDLEKDERNLISGTMTGLTVKYVKGGCKPEPVIKFGETELKAGTDYTLSYQNNKNTADASAEKAPVIKIKGKGNFKGTRTEKFSITAKNLADAECPVSIAVEDKAYARGVGKYVSKPVLTDTDGKVLKAGTDYEVTYTLADGITKLDKRSTVKEGAYICVTARGKGKYEGTLMTTYRITRSSFTKASIKVTPKEYTGGYVYLTGEDDLTVTVGATRLTYGKDYEILEDSYVNNVRKGTASVKVRGLGDYGGTKTVKFKIQAKKMESFSDVVRRQLLLFR